MGLWNYYFIAKIALFLGGYTGFHRWENLFFAAALLIPLRRSAIRTLRLVLAVPVAIALLYYDSWLPSVSRVLGSMSALQGFSADYLVELLGRFVNLHVVGTLFGLCLVIAALGRKLRISSFVIVAMLLTPQLAALPNLIITTMAPKQADCQPNSTDNPMASQNVTGDQRESSSETDPDKVLQAFYAEESKRQVLFDVAKTNSKPFDILVVHICSLAWDDMRYVKEQHPLFQRFDILFTNFNSAATYSGPAAIRLLRASCGQQQQSELYRESAPQCYLFDALQTAGYAPNLLLNHDGNYENFLANLGKLGGLDVPSQGNFGARLLMNAFYGSPIYEDYDLLSKWWQKRLATLSAPAALYYNTISLHDGNKILGKESLSSLDTFKPRMEKLFDDLDHFINDVQSAGRPAVVIFIPEHGAALRGDKVQIAGMREIPSPAITLIPVGIKFIGLAEAAAPKSQLVVDQEYSYFALATLLSDLVRHSPFSGAQFDLAATITNLPKTRFVAENEETVMLKMGSKYRMRTPDQTWADYQIAQ